MDQLESQNGIERGEPDVSEARRALVTEILAEVKKDAAKWAPAFRRIRKDQAFVRTQLPEETPDDERAKVNIVQRHVNQRVATLYAKNPTFVAGRRRRLDYAVWDGKRQSLEAAAMQAQAGDPTALPLLQDIQRAVTQQTMLDKVGKTMEILLDYAVAEQQPPFKAQAKQTVRRAIVCSVGYCKLQYQRQLTKRPDNEAKLSDITDRVAHVEMLSADMADQKLDENAAGAEELVLAQEALQTEPDIVVREGLVFDWPKATNIIPDRKCTQLTVGFPGARRVSEQFLLSSAEIKKIYGVDVGDSYTGYVYDSAKNLHTPCETDAKQALVYETYDKDAGLLYVTCEGYPDFLEDPAPPPLSYLEPFFPFYPLVFNPIEDDNDIYPDSDVRLLMPIQTEINRKREAIRQHRFANRPLNVTRRGMLTQDDAKDLSSHPAHAIIELQNLEAGDDVTKVFAPFPKPGVDPNLYETGTDLTDVQLVVGAQEANLGGTSGDSATENSIAEQSRLTSIASNIDEVDDWLSAIARGAGQVLLYEVVPEEAVRLAGPGAVWPELKAQEIAEEVYLEIEAGSSGRPNKTQELADIERATPLLVQLPGVNPEWLTKKVLRVLDPRVDLEEAFTYGLPSITQANSQTQPGTGDPATDPNAQGGAGADNAPAPQAGTGGPQASYQTDQSNGAPGFA